MLTLKDGRGECRCCLLSLVLISERYAARRGQVVAKIRNCDERGVGDISALGCIGLRLSLYIGIACSL